MVTVPPVMLASVRLPTVSLNRTLPLRLFDPKEVTTLFFVSSVMAEPLPLTVKAPAVTAPL